MRIARPLSAAFAAATLLATTAATASAADFREYVALGDSYTSGPFIPVQSLDPLGCGRSNANYPSVLAGKLGVGSFTDVSCAGADTTNMTRPEAVPFNGTNKPQFDGLKVGTDLVTLGIGGDDFGLFSRLIETCPTLRAADPTGNPCEERFTSGGVDTAKAAIENIEPRVEAVLAGIHQHAPGASIYVIGYPRILPDSGYCPDILPFADGDYEWLASVERALNSALEDAATNSDASFVDTYGPSRGHDACARGGAAWINGKDDKLFAAKAYHPYKVGMAGIADIILKQLH